MRSLLIPALILVTGIPTLADGNHQEWKRRSHEPQQYEYRPNGPRNYGPHFEGRPARVYQQRARYRRPYPQYQYQREEVVYDRPEPVIVHVRPAPVIPPPPVSLHFWFGF